MHKSAVAAVAALSLFISDAHAQDAAIDEIVVTADLRGRTLVEIPASIAVINRSTVEDAAVQHFEELSFLVPNLNFAGGSNRARYFQLRGIGERSQYEGAPNPSVGFILDDIDFSGIGGIATTWDIERVEVLRGPQATRYGANALAGLVFVQSVAPTPEFDARAQVTSGDDGLASAALAFGGPVNDTLGYRVALQQFQSNGFRDNPFLGRDDTNERDELTLRTRLRWDLSNETRVDTTLLFVDQDNGYDAFTLENDFTTFSDDPGRDAQRSVGLGIRADHAPSAAWSFTSITGIAQSDVEFSFDADWGNPDYWIPFFAAPGSTPFTPEYDFFSRRDRERDTINQEFRLQSGPDGRLFDDTTDWLAGVYALRLTEDLTVFDSGVFSDGTFPGDPFAASSDSSYESLKLAVFGQLDIATGERTDLSLGLRVERRTADYEDDFGLSRDPSETAVGGHISLTHAINDAATGYVSLARGYKMGGFNLGTVPDGRREFDAEYLWNLETGLRWQHERGSLSLAVFYAERRDQQVSTSFQLVPNDPSTFVFFQDNAASGKNLGAELESRWQLDAHWSAYANVGLLDVTFDDFVTPEVDLSGREQAHAPRYSFAAGLVWERPEGWFARLDVQGRDEFFFSNSHDEKSDAYTLVHARAGYRTGPWQFSAWGRNLTDEDYGVRGFFFGNEPPNFDDTLYLRLGDPRQVGVSIDWRY